MTQGTPGRVMALAVAFALAGGAVAQAAGPEGRWVTASGNVVVAIAPCAGGLCGTIDRVLANRSMAHPGQAMAAAPGVGLKILTGLKPDGAGRWTGHIYNRENGRTYDCQVTVADAGHLTVRPFVGLPLFGQTQVWRRAAAGQ